MAVEPLPAGLSVAEAARRLGVKRETVYAYVSRGLLSSRRRPGGRESLLDAGEVARLAARQRGGAGRAGSLEVVVDSGLTLLDPDGHLYYRGWDVTEAAKAAWFEEVALFLWGQPAEDARQLFEAPAGLLEPARAAAALPPADAAPLDRLLLALAAAGSADPYRHSREPEGTARRGARMIAVLVEALPRLAEPAAEDGPAPVAERLWCRLARRAPSAAETRAMNAALVLLADHELATSTLAARVAASTRADLYRVVMAGMAAVGGPLHGGAGDRAARLVSEAAERGVERAVGDRLASGEELAGFGHLVYRRADPRAEALLEALRSAFSGNPFLEAADGVIAAVRAERPAAFPNVDLALGTFVGAAGMAEGSAEAIFTTARLAGWVAHGMEEYGHRLRFRTRAAYTGPEPGSVPPLGEPPAGPLRRATAGRAPASREGRGSGGASGV